MTTIRKTITLTSKLDEWIKSQTNDGEFTNDSEYIRDLVRRDQDQKSKLLALKAAIQEGLDSGVSDRTVGEIWAEAEARHQAKSG
jgi:antitoxin ParD1/3/4